jgi:hypothetical protein
VRYRDARGRFISTAAARASKNQDLADGLPLLAAAIAEETPRPRRTVGTSIYSIEVVPKKALSWARLVRVLEDADLRQVPKRGRLRYQMAGRDAEGIVRPLSRAYASAELALGEAIATLEGDSVLSPKEGEDVDSTVMWQSIVVNGYLRKDAMR